MTIVDTFNTVETAIKQAIDELKKSLESGKISESRATHDGMIEEWVHDFQIPNNEGVFRLKILIERTTENGSERLPIVEAKDISLTQSAQAYATQRQRAANVLENKVAVVCKDSMDFQYHIKAIYDAIASRDRNIVVDLSRGFAIIENPKGSPTKYFLVCDDIDLHGVYFHSVEKTAQVDRFTYLNKLYKSALLRVIK